MQFSKISLTTLFLASLSTALTVDESIAARDLVVAKAAGTEKRDSLQERAPKKSKVKGGSGFDDDEDDDDDQNAATSIHINMALITGASAVVIAAMMI